MAKVQFKWLLPIFGLCILGAFLFFTFQGTDNWKRKLPMLGYIQDFEFINQDSLAVGFGQMQGKVYVANYFFATCKAVCPVMNGNLKDIYLKHKGDSNFAILSHTCQPEYDTIAVLKMYTAKMEADGKQWQFVTGSKLELYRTARESYKIDDPKNNVGEIQDQFLHTQFVALVDKSGRLRGVYDALKKAQMRKLSGDILTLLNDEKGNGLLESIFGYVK